jgi:alkylated DNA nucleotide flippase Atl1
LLKQGLVLEESEDPHHLAWWRVVDADGGEASPELALKLWRHLARFSGRTQEIEG